MTNNFGQANFTIRRGHPLPMGVSELAEGLNFVIHSRHATQVVLYIQPLTGDDRPLLHVELDVDTNRTGAHWHVQIVGLPTSGFRYSWLIDGPLGTFHRFDPTQHLVDPYAAILSDASGWGTTCEVDRHSTNRRGIYIPAIHFDWQDDIRPNTPMPDSIVYELHVRGFTCHPSAGVAHPGTFAGLVEKIPYLKKLGITAVELLPIHEFDECDCPFQNPETGEYNRNYWGYNSLAFFAPKAAYAATAAQHGQFHEFRDMVKAFHDAGIEVWLDVVFNHTGEADDRGRTFSFRGLDNSIYYMLTKDGRYQNFTGCGNTVNCNHPIVRNMILDCLRFWVGEMHIDGFRFDLASIFGRDADGNVINHPPIVEMITEDGLLRDTKLVAEPWDAVGLQHVGNFPYGSRWSEWNDHYRDQIRQFWRGDFGTLPLLATRICGSSDLYQWNGRNPCHSVNFITSHDGFTLNDLVSYNHKHNMANGEQNRDGMNENYSWNCGIEGETSDEQILRLRTRQAKNFFATLMLSQGVPMFVAGDEFLRTQQGNNNAWCQDNEFSWVDWNLTEKNSGMLRFVQEMIQFRKRHPVLRRNSYFRGELSTVKMPSSIAIDPKAEKLPSPPQPSSLPRQADIHWHGLEPYQPEFSAYSRMIAYSLDGRFSGREDILGNQPDHDLYVAINGDDTAHAFRIPPSPQGFSWKRIVDTALDSPNDILAESSEELIAVDARYVVAAYSLIVLISDQQND
ncbi:MAG: glycogen debranching protein GlgX [Zavarzinella sp.]